MTINEGAPGGPDGSEEKIKLLMAPPGMNVWLGCFAASLHLDGGVLRLHKLTNSGGYFPLTGLGRPPQTIHNNSEHNRPWNPADFCSYL